VTAKKGATAAAPAPGAAGTAGTIPPGGQPAGGAAAGAGAGIVATEPETTPRCSCLWSAWSELKERIRKPYVLESCLCIYYVALAGACALFYLAGDASGDAIACAG
jgi:hypothetical protein